MRWVCLADAEAHVLAAPPTSLGEGQELREGRSAAEKPSWNMLRADQWSKPEPQVHLTLGGAFESPCELIETELHPAQSAI